MSQINQWQKWRLLLTLLPWTLLFGLAKVAVHQLHWEIWTFDSLTGTLFAAATFILAFMLSGTLRDYYDSAYMPLELANAIVAIADANQLAAQAHPNYDAAPLRTALATITHNILDWLENHQPMDPVEAALENLNTYFAQMVTLGDIPVISRAHSEQARIRLLLNRIRLIRDTAFLQPAYTLLEIFLIGTSATLLLVTTAPFSQNLIISTLLFVAFAYLLQLIRDLDNPFEYGSNSHLDVDLSALHETKQHLNRPSASTQETSTAAPQNP